MIPAWLDIGHTGQSLKLRQCETNPSFFWVCEPLGLRLVLEGIEYSGLSLPPLVSVRLWQ